MLSPWETPLKLSLYVIYTENKAWAKKHRVCLFKHNSHGPWKMIKACSSIVNIHIFRMSSFKMELLHLMSTSQYNRQHFLTDYCKINLREQIQLPTGEGQKSINQENNGMSALWKVVPTIELLNEKWCLEKTAQTQTYSYKSGFLIT